MLSRKGFIGINNVDASCWIASTLQAIVDCPPLLNLILTGERIIKSQYEVEIQKKKLYIRELRDISNDVIDHYRGYIIQGKNNVEQFKTRITAILTDEETFISSLQTLEELIQQRALPTINDLQVFVEENFNDRVLIERYSKDLFFWASYDFDVELRRYLYALVTYVSSTQLCLNPTNLRRTMVNMNQKNVLFSDDFNTNFVPRVEKGTEKLTFFLSIIFQNLDFLGIYYDNKNLKLCNDDVKLENRAITFKVPTIMDRIKYGYANFTMQELIAVSVRSEPIRNNFVVIESTEYEDSSTPNHIKTEKKIFIDDKPYKLCSVVIFCGRGHYRTITTKGQFDDGQVLPGTQYLDDFCKNGYSHHNKGEGDDTKHPGLLWFYEREPELDINLFTDFTKNLHYCEYHDKNDVSLWTQTIQQKLEETFNISPQEIVDKSPIQFIKENQNNQDENIKGAIAYIKKELKIDESQPQQIQSRLVGIEKFKHRKEQELREEILNQKQILDKQEFLYELNLEVEELERQISVALDRANRENKSQQEMDDLRSYINNVRNELKKKQQQALQEFLECQQQQKIQELNLPAQYEPLRLQVPSAPSQPIPSSTVDKFAVSPQDLLEEEGIFVYFKKFTLQEIREYVGKSIGIDENKVDMKQTAFNFYKQSKVAYNALLGRFADNKIKDNIKSAQVISKVGAAAKSESRNVLSSSATENSFWTENGGAIKQIVLKIIGAENIDKVNFNLNKDEFIKDIQKDNNTLSPDKKSEVILALDPQYFSRNKKYLKYKNKYLQMKRLENNSKHTF
jgi:hypothetical protein